MIDKRRKDANWNVVTESNNYFHDEHYRMASLSVLMDIRDELKRLNSVIGCFNFLRIPAVLDRIVVNTRKPTRKRKKVAKS